MFLYEIKSGTDSTINQLQCVITACWGNQRWRLLCIRGLQTFLSEGYISYFTTVRVRDILRNVTVSGYVTFRQIIKFFVNILSSHY